MNAKIQKLKKAFLSGNVSFVITNKRDREALYSVLDLGNTPYSSTDKIEDNLYYSAVLETVYSSDSFYKGEKYHFSSLADFLSCDPSIFDATKLKLNSSYTAEILENKVRVGCQEFSFDIIEELYSLIQKKKSAKTSSKKNQEKKWRQFNATKNSKCPCDPDDYIFYKVRRRDGEHGPAKAGDLIWKECSIASITEWRCA